MEIPKVTPLLYKVFRYRDNHS